MDFTKEQKQILLKKARREELTGFQAGWLEVAHILHVRRGKGPLFTDKQIKILREPFRLSMRKDTLERDLIADIPRKLNMTKNELLAFYWAIQKNLDSACITMLTKLHNKKSKEQFRTDFLLQGKELNKNLKVHLDMGCCLAYETILEKLSQVLQLPISSEKETRDGTESAVERYNYFLSQIKDRPGFKKEFGGLSYLSFEDAIIDRDYYLILKKDRFFFDSETSIVDLQKFEPAEMLNG